ncbi:MAG: hypothetical protein QOJ08_1958, partial [Ilumatobacteraceae bacterium]
HVVVQFAMENGDIGLGASPKHNLIPT